ncbi:magnesium/cobalt transporter CorA [Mucilaginibacter ginkgonis]|uniref:Magnesium transport protein CorA n=1 Tax=Mucilaginibacter ginkgonis TaxID=2682091 RepID=A0A6I4HWN8_9SPHI|nr:magnesium/cobalt transporter CorA [Mucilaginibacter ginkgonis]QQL51119.1 magnesium/cobalt transporter CorA [Mucilaginibacter ginkgonis]
MNTNRHHLKAKFTGKVGDMPGTLTFPDDALKPKIVVYSYNADEVQSSSGSDIEVILKQFKKCPKHTHWIKINGIGDAQLIEKIGELLNINVLVLEDIANTHQRPKFDEYDGYVFATSRIIEFDDKHEITSSQFAAIVKDDIIITFEENYEKRFDVVVTRLKAGKGAIRTAGPGYMCYALMDTIIDQYFVVLADIGEALDTLEDRLYEKADKSIMYDSQHLKRALIMMRRVSWPERDKINDMIRSESALITPEVKTYLRDAYDHCIHIMDVTDSYKEITTSVMDLYLSMVSNRMNEIMKVLTIISVIFMPLTFIAGIYGMNFQRQDDKGHVIPDNMPELYMHHAYPVCVAIMILIAGVQLWYFTKKGWFSKL